MSALTPLQKAFMAIQEAESRAAAAEAKLHAPIAIVGLACRAPGGVRDARTFWDLLSKGRDAIGPIPQGRWDHDALYDPDPDARGKISARNGGFLEQVDQFDPEFFGVSPREADGMDPQQRMLLEVCWEALESAGQAPDRLQCSPTGVYVGAAGADYAYMQMRGQTARAFDAHFASGVAHSVLSGRVSYLLGLQGPSITIDTACSSSLVAVHLACQALRNGECGLALAGGVNLILSPEVFVALSQARMLAPDGRCKTFDVAADGFGRGEGCAIVALKLLTQAEADADRVLAVIRGSAVNQDGASSGLTVPNGPAQEAVMRAALRQARIEPRQVSYVEAHGTGTELGDPLEMRALGAVFGSERTAPLLVGSVKTNIGHLEAAAGVIGLVKLVLSLQHGAIPKHLHFNIPSPHIAWDELNLAVPTQQTPWPAIEGRRIAGVSSFGFSGTNTHVVVEAPPEIARKSPPPQRAWALPLSAPDQQRLAALAEVTSAAFAGQTPLADVARTLGEGRAHFAERAVVRAASSDEARVSFAALARDENATAVVRGRAQPGDPPRVAFLFTGQGAQFSGMGAGLYETSDVFRSALDQCDALFEPLIGASIKQIMFDPGRAAMLDQTGNAQPALFAFEYALAELWRSFGVRPVAALGHSLGEYVAACVGGAISLEDTVKLIAARGRLMQSLPAGGAMAAAFASEARVAKAIASHADAVAIAAINGPAQVVISGSATAIEAARAALADDKIKTRVLTVSHAFHSPLMGPILDAFEREVSYATFKAPRLRLISNLTGRAVRAEDIAAPDYWRRHLRSPVRFADGLAALASAKVDICLEVGPQPVLTALAAATFDGEDAPRLIASVRKGSGEWESVLDAAATLHVAGVEVDWSAQDRERAGRPIDMPLSHFRRMRCWFRADPRAAGDATGGIEHPLLGAKTRSAAAHASYEARFSATSPQWLGEHRVLDRVIAPGALLLEMMRVASDGARLEDVELSEALVVEDGADRIVQTIVRDEGEARVAFVESIGENDADDATWRRHASARVERVALGALNGDLAGARAACTNAVNVGAFYETFAPRGLSFGPSFHSVRTIWRGSNEALGEIDVTGLAMPNPGGLHPLLLDGCLQVAGAALPEGAAMEAFVPAAVGAYEVRRTPGDRAIARARVAPAGNGYRAEIVIFDAGGEPVAQLKDVRFMRASRAAPARRADSVVEQLLYEIAWREQPKAADSASGLTAQDLAALAGADVERLAREAGLTSSERVLAQVEAACPLIAARALQQLGWAPGPGTLITAETLRAQLRVAARHQRLFDRVLAILAEAGWLAREGQHWRVIAAPPDHDPTSDLQTLASNASAGGAAMIHMLLRVGSGLAQALTGARDPIDLLFPDGGTEEAEILYRDSPAAIVFNTMLAEAAAELARRAMARGERFEVLEVGAGTGGTTARVLPRLPLDGAHYVYTDVGPAFVTKARARFGDDARLEFRTLDLERDPETQGFEVGRYDLIIAANVLHATADLRKSLARIKRMLKPGGVLALCEVTARQRWFDLTVGLTPGWWAFADLDLRPDYPTLTPPQWIELLEANGFAAAAAGTVRLGAAGARDAVIFGRSTGPGKRNWALVGDGDGLTDAIARELVARGDRVIRLPDDAHNDKAALKRLFAEGGVVDGVVTTRAMDFGARDAAGAAAELAALADVLTTLSIVPRLFVLTRGAQGEAKVTAPDQAPAWGMVRSLAREAPELRATAIDLDPSRGGEDLAALVLEIAAAGEETQVVFRDGVRMIPRLTRANLTPAPDVGRAAWRLVASSAGSFGAFRKAALARRAPGPGEVEIETAAWGLNFKDILNALGLYPGDPGPLGGECAGHVVAVGEGVADMNVGDAVMAVASGAFATHVTARRELLQPVPQGMSLEEAAAFPIAWLTALFCLDHVAKVKRGDRVLIHAAAGGVGLAAVRLAQRAGATVFATAGAPWKRDALVQASVRHVYDSRSPAFADAILKETDGAGVDVVLNSLAGEMMDASFRVIATGGRFVEIGKNGLKDEAWVRGLDRDIGYTVVDWGETAAREPALIRGLFERLARDAGALAPLPRSTFAIDDAALAFRTIAQARHAGKIVLRRTSPAIRIRRDGTYLVSGGLSGIGFETAQWLAREGAGKLVLFGRRGATSEVEGAIETMRAAGVEVWAERLDVADRAGLAALLQRVRASWPPLRGVIHAAGALDNATLGNLDIARFRSVFAAKHDGAAFLNELTRIDALDFFLLYSSIASVFGAAGQANHAGANAFMDALAHQRRRDGLPALSINWGAWGGVGAAVDSRSYLAAQGVAAFLPAQGIGALERILDAERAQMTVASIDWPAYVESAAHGETPPFLREVVDVHASARANKPAQKAEPAEARVEIERAPIERRAALVAALVGREAAAVLGFAQDRQIDPRLPLGELGLDSLMAVDLRNRLGQALRARFPSTLLFDCPTVAALSTYIGETVFGAPQATVEAKEETDSLLESIGDLSDEAIDELIAARHGAQT